MGNIPLTVLLLGILAGAWHLSGAVVIDYYVWPSNTESYKTQHDAGVGGNPTVGEMMDAIAKEGNPKFQFDYKNSTFGRYVTCIGGVCEDIDRQFHWMLFKPDDAPSQNSPPTDDKLAELGIDGMFAKDGDHFLFWRKYVDY